MANGDDGGGAGNVGSSETGVATVLLASTYSVPTAFTLKSQVNISLRKLRSLVLSEELESLKLKAEAANESNSIKLKNEFRKCHTRVEGVHIKIPGQHLVEKIKIVGNIRGAGVVEVENRGRW
jgi:hypothetical protein